MGPDNKPVCRETAYPRTDAVMITLVQSPDGSHCLLGRQAAFPAGFYSCLAGYLEAGEALEEGAAREVQEESGVSIDYERMKYAGSQPWPLGRGVYGQVMVGFLATALPDASVSSASAGDADVANGGTSRPGTLPTINIDRDELQDARWYSRAEVLTCLQQWYAEAGAATIGGDTAAADVQTQLRIPGPYAIAHQLIKAWVDGHATELVSHPPSAA
jgi:NAD+ diphosphatase